VLTTGFAARVDASLKVATIAETITVAGETPIVDLTSTPGRHDRVEGPHCGGPGQPSGQGKTVIKGTYGWFNEDLGLGSAPYPQQFNVNSLVDTTYRWRDLNRDGNYQ
jgi:hypothetical protein